MQGFNGYSANDGTVRLFALYKHSALVNFNDNAIREWVTLQEMYTRGFQRMIIRTDFIWFIIGQNKGQQNNPTNIQWVHAHQMRHYYTQPSQFATISQYYLLSRIPFSIVPRATPFNLALHYVSALQLTRVPLPRATRYNARVHAVRRRLYSSCSEIASL